MGMDFFEHVKLRDKPLIIAEIGANYGGIETVSKMVECAHNSGADMVKFQTYQAETISTPGSYFTFEDGSRVSQFEFFKHNELKSEDHDTLSQLCKKLNMPWTSTPSHVTDLALLEKYDLPCYKTGSDDLTNTPFLSAIAETGRTMLVSTGMCTLSEIENAVDAIVSAGNNRIILLHCVVSYPSKIQDANLRVIETLQRAFGFPVGLSDHTTDELTSLLAVQLGACVIEKHFTLDHALRLPDHQASLDPSQFKILVDRVSKVNDALGNGVKNIMDTEKKWRKAARKSIFVKKEIKANQVIDTTDLEIRRPSDGLHPKYFEIVVGRKAAFDLEPGTLLNLEMIK